MNLKHLDDDQLLVSTKNAVQVEREATTSVLHHLREVDRRRLYSKLECESLHDFAEKHLGYPGDQAYRRIAAMKLLKEFPEIEAKITSGALSLTHLNMAKTLFNKEKFSQEKKLEFLEDLENTSTRKAAKMIATISPQALIYDTVKLVTETKAEYKFNGPIELQDKLETLKGLLAHSHPNISMGDLVNKLADMALEKFTAPRKIKKASNLEKSKTQNASGLSKISAKPPSQASIFRQVAERDGYQCANCKSRFALQTDHIIPRAVGGRSTLTNMRLLCRNCNQRAAIEYFGINKMERYLRSPITGYN